MAREERRTAAPWPLDRRELRHRVRLWMPSTPQTVGEAVRRVARIAARSGCDEDRRSDIEIAVHEAVANALQHGNGAGRDGAANGDDPMIFVRCYADARGRLVIAVRDEGPGFEPSSVPDPRHDERRELPNGRGLLLMRELSDHVAYRKGGREVVLYVDCGD